MASITTAPTEIILIILQDIESFKDVASLAQTCRRLHTIADACLLARDVATLEPNNNGPPSALHWAAYTNSPSLLGRALPVAGADVNRYWAPEKSRNRRRHPRRYADAPSIGDHEYNIADYYKGKPPFVLQCTALHLAAAHGNEEAVRLLLANGARVNLPSRDLCRCTLEDGMYGTQKAGSDPNRNVGPEFGFDGFAGHPLWTPLHLALCYGHDALARLFLDAGAKMYTSSAAPGEQVSTYVPHQPEGSPERNEAWAVLNMAVFHGCVETLERQLAQDDQDILVKVNAGEEDHAQSLMHHAARGAHLTKVLPILLKYGGDIEARNANHRTPLAEICFRQKYDKVPQLLAAGADANDDGGERGLAPLLWLCDPRVCEDYQGYDITDRIRGSRRRRPGEMEARARAAEELLDHGADVNAQAKAGRVWKEQATAGRTWNETPLHFAAADHDVRMLEVLLARGADVNAWAGDGRHLTPLRFAMSGVRRCSPRRLIETVKLLLRHGGDIYGHQPDEEISVRPEGWLSASYVNALHLGFQEEEALGRLLRQEIGADAIPCHWFEDPRYAFVLDAFFLRRVPLAIERKSPYLGARRKGLARRSICVGMKAAGSPYRLCIFKSQWPYHRCTLSNEVKESAPEVRGEHVQPV